MTVQFPSGIRPLQRFYRRYLDRYRWARHARNAFVNFLFFLNPVGLVVLATLSGRLTKFRALALPGVPPELLASRVSIHPQERVEIPGPRAWRDAGAAAIEPGLHYAYLWPEAERYALREAVVVGRSDLVFARQWALHHPLLNVNEHALAEELHLRGVFAPGRRTYFRIESTHPEVELPEAVHLIGSCSANYAHWLTEMLPRVLLADLAPQCRGLPLVIDADLHRNLLASIAALSPDRARHVELQPGQRARVARLHWLCTPTFVPFDYRKPLLGKRPAVTRRQDAVRHSPFALRLLRDRALALVPALAKPTRRLFVRRMSGIRMLVNQDEIEAALRAEGFEVVDPGQLTFLEQVALFGEASLVVAQTGAALANLLFAPAGCRALILIGESPYAYYQYYSNLAHLAGVEAYQLLGPVVRNAAWHPTHQDFTAGVPQLLRAVRALAA